MLTSMSACTWESKSPSFLVVAVDSFPFESVKCNDFEKNKGFKIICDEMIRFTHAYTPSILTQPSLASLFTGKYPFEHGVWNNGPTYLSAKLLTSAEVAVQKGYKTLFVSGGVPAWKRSGLDQGFEIFEDNISVDYRRYYREVAVNVGIFTDWLKKEVDETPFYAFLYLNDLQFPDFPTVDNDGFPREKTYEGQLREIDESLERLFEELKKQNVWNKTWIIVVGVNGLSRDIRLDEAIGTNLYHENTNVALFIKPPSTQEHPKAVRTIDSNVSLVDVGRLLFDLLDFEFYETTKSFFKTISLKKYILSNVEEDAGRILLFESGWPQWRQVGQTKFALQKDNYLLVYEEKPKLFNTLIDRNQVYPIDYKQNSFQVLTDSAAQLVALMNNTEKTALSSDIVQKYRLSHAFFKKEGWNSDFYPEVLSFYKRTKDKEIAGWLATYYIDNENWKELLQLGEEVKNSDWIWVAAQNLVQSAEKIIPPEPHICLRMISDYEEIESEKIFEERCEDVFLQTLFGYLKFRGKMDKREYLVKIYRQYKTEYEIQRLNYQNGYIWDTQNNFIIKPHYVELIFSIPQLSRIKRLLDQSI